MKRRADQAVVDFGLAESRTRAQALILAGNVYVGEQRVEKPGDFLPDHAVPTLRGPDHAFVSRGGVKLDHAIRHFELAAEGRVCLDVGSSTGGFTDVLLQNGASRVYAVDVGHGQLDWRLRQDARVVVRERLNARYMTAEHVPEPVNALVCDASFIGLQTILPVPLSFCAPGAWAVALIKPQFEAGPRLVGKGGIVRDPEVRQEVCDRIESWWKESPDWRVLGITESPISGAEGNQEYLIAAVRV